MSMSTGTGTSEGTERGAGGVEVALIGREQRGDENLSLRCLASALAGAGHRPRILPMNGPHDAARVAGAVAAGNFAAAGLAISDADAAVDLLALAKLLRRRGFGGHITCGGVLATLVRFDLLERHPELDSVVRHDGEMPIAAIAGALARGEDVAGIAGVTTRSGDGAPAEVCSRVPLGVLPLRKRQLPRIMGIPTARMLASRGCTGRCTYCAPAAVRREAEAEGRRGGADAATMRRLGVGGLRRRAVEEVAGEMAGLYHRRGARFFHFLDDNWLPEGEPGCLEVVRELDAALERRDVGQRAVTLQAPASAMGEELAGALVRLGLVRVLLGVEAFHEKNLQSFGRAGSAGTNERALEILRRKGVMVFFNSLLVHPDATEETVEAELEALRGIEGALFDTVVLAVHTGSSVWRRLQREGRLEGNSLAWRYRAASRVVERLRAVMFRMRRPGSGRYDATVLVNDVAMGIWAGRRLGHRWASGEAAERAGTLMAECNALKLRAVEEAFSLSRREMESGERAARVERLVGEVRARNRALVRKAERLEWELMRGAGIEKSRGGTFLRSCLAAGFALCLGTAAGGCYRSTGAGMGTGDAVEAGEVVDGAEAEADGTVDLDAGPDFDAFEPPHEPVFDAPPYCDDPHSDAFGEVTDWSAEEECDEYLTTQQRIELEGLANDQEACGSCLPPWDYCYAIVLDEEGRAVDVVNESGEPIPEPVRRCYLEVLGQYMFPCLGGEAVDFLCPPYPVI